MKNPSKSRPKAKTKRKSNPYRRKKTIAKRKKGRRSRKFTIPIAAVTAVALPALKLLTRQGPKGQPMHEIQAGNWANAGEALVDNATHLFAGQGLMEWVPGSVAALLVHKFVGGSPLNLNRTLANAGVPFFRI